MPWPFASSSLLRKVEAFTWVLGFSVGFRWLKRCLDLSRIVIQVGFHYFFLLFFFYQGIISVHLKDMHEWEIQG